MVRLSTIKQIAKNYNLTMQQALNALHKCKEFCPQCKQKSLLDYYCSDGITYACLCCNYTTEN